MAESSNASILEIPEWTLAGLDELLGTPSIAAPWALTRQNAYATGGSQDFEFGEHDMFPGIQEWPDMVASPLYTAADAAIVQEEPAARRQNSVWLWLQKIGIES